MAVHIRQPRGRLVGRQREREFWVHEREPWPLIVVAVAGLEPELVVGHDGVFGGLAAGGGNREHDGDRENGVARGLRLEERPDILVDARTIGDRFGRVDDRATADRDDPIDGLALAERHTLAHKRDLGIWPHAAKAETLDADGLKRIFDSVEQPAALGASAAVVDQRPPRPGQRVPAS